MTTKKKKYNTRYPARELTEDTRWIVCMWDIRGEAPEETAMILKRSLSQVENIITECKADGFYEKVHRHIEDFDMVNAQRMPREQLTCVQTFCDVL